MSESIVMVACAVVGAFCGQFSASLLFPSVSLAEKKELLAWAEGQEVINRLLRERVERLEAFAKQSEAEIAENWFKKQLATGLPAEEKK